jgi:NAD-dependent SIR2 family protein deacetylase
MPTWGDIVKKICKEINEDSERDYLKIAQYFYNNLGKELYHKRLESYFPIDIVPSKIHDCLFDINPDIIITTNWDTLLEQANDRNVSFYDVIVSDRELVESKKPHKIIKMHGDFLHNNIVFKEDDYLNYQENFPLIENYIKSILSTHIVLFIGYS